MADVIFSLEPKKIQHLGIDDDGVTSYYTPNITTKDIAKVQKCLELHKIRSENTRVAKFGENEYRVRVSSANVSAKPFAEFDFEGAKITVCDGGFSSYLSRAVDYLYEARKYAANEKQERMIDAYIKHFKFGDIEDHKESQRIWVKDMSPNVETDLGFVETYGDPIGVRAEWEGFVAVTNKEMSKSYNLLVENSKELISKMPWGVPFEKNIFIKPDFTAIDILNYCTTGLPLGINIPNYDDVREQYGFKNVTLTNAMSIAYGNGKESKIPPPLVNTSFVSPSDAAILIKSRADSFALNVGLHELLGHGSGKVFTEDAAGNKNFDPLNVISPLTGKPVTSWYKHGQTYDSVLKELASPMEECRAESVGLLLSTEPLVLSIFGHVPPSKEGEVHDVTYANWIGLSKDGLTGFGAFNPETGKWGQAHVNARHAIMRQLIKFGVAKIELVGENDLLYSIDRTKIMSDGVAAIRDLLTHLQVYRATGDYEGAKKFFWEGLSAVDLSDKLFSEARRRALLVKKPRRQLVQCVPMLGEDGKIVIKSFEGSPLGMVQSYQERFPEDIINPNEEI